MGKCGGMTILDEAKGLVYGDRGEYGTPLDQFSCVASMWSAYLSYRNRMAVKIEAEDIAPLMQLFKLSRRANGYKRDTVVDIAGYGATDEMVHDERARRNANV